MKKISSLLFAICLFQFSKGQLNYTFSAASGTYTPIAGTVAALTISTQFFEAPDEGFSNGIPLGFTFKYNNVDYVSISVHTNGFASFSNFVVANEFAGQSYFFNDLSDGPIGLPSVRPVLAPLWDDMNLTVNSNLTYITSGAAPNRIFTLQWANVKWPHNANAANISFQLKLYETTNVIEFVYQPLGVSSPNRSASIGITGTAKGTNNFLSLNNASAAPTVSGTAETDIISTAPAAGQVYRFTPTGALPVTLIDFSAVRRNGINFLSWSTQTEQNNTGFELQRSENETNFSMLAVIASKANNGNSTSALSYEFKDLEPLNKNNYYRLKQINKDGTSTLSPIVLVKGFKESSLTISSIYPNPLKDNLSMVITSPANERITIEIVDVAGKLVKKQTTMLLSGNNKLSLDVTKINPGTYIIKVVCYNGCKTAVSKFAKQ